MSYMQVYTFNLTCDGINKRQGATTTTTTIHYLLTTHTYIHEHKA